MKRRSGGFTLIELLVALAIVSLVAVLSWQGLDNVIRLTQRVRTNDDQWEQIRAVFAQLEKDFRAVHNPRNTAPPADPQTGTGSGQTARSGNQAGAGRQRAADRTDVTVENDDALDQVVNAALANTQRVQVRNGALEIVNSQTSPKEGPTTLQVRWIYQGGQWRREQQALVQKQDGPGDAAALARQQNPKLQALFDEPGLIVRSIGVRLWIEGRGWDAEQALGEPLPPEPVQSSAAPVAQVAPGQAPQGQAMNPGSVIAAVAGPLRVKGVQVRLWLPSGDIYTRVFMLGQES